MAQDLRQGLCPCFTGSTCAGSQGSQADGLGGHETPFAERLTPPRSQYSALSQAGIGTGGLRGMPSQWSTVLSAHPRLLLPAAAIVAFVVVACSSGESTTPERTLDVIIRTPNPSPTSVPADQSRPGGGAETGREPELVSLSWLGQSMDVPPLPAFATPGGDPGLLAAVETALAGVGGRASVVVHNVEDGRSAAIDEREVYYAASTYKLGLLYEAYRQRDAGILDFAKVVTLEQKYADHDLGTLEILGLRAGDTLTIADAIKAMIIVSDTPCAALLQDTVGGRTADATLRNLGIEDTSFNNRSLPATPADLVTLLEAIAGGKGVSGESRAEMLQLLLQEGYEDGVHAGVPADTPVAHKTGSYSDATHDVALVWGPAGPYIIAVMTDQPNNWPLIAGVSKAVWDYFAATP